MSLGTHQEGRFLISLHLVPTIFSWTGRYCCRGKQSPWPYRESKENGASPRLARTAVLESLPVNSNYIHTWYLVVFKVRSLSSAAQYWHFFLSIIRSMYSPIRCRAGCRWIVHGFGVAQASTVEGALLGTCLHLPTLGWVHLWSCAERCKSFAK